jgi:hypothetical protein
MFGEDGDDQLRAASDGAVDRINCGPGADQAWVDANDVFIGLWGLPVTAAAAGCETGTVV